MNEEQLYNYMNEVMKQIPAFLKKEDVLKRHLRFMRYFPDYEWFNIASILYCMPSAINVKSTDAWSSIFGRELYPKMGSKGLISLIPLYSAESELRWKVVKVFDISQMATKIKPVYSSPLKEIIDRLGMNGLKCHLGDGWQEKFILEAATANDFYNSHSELQPFIRNAVTFCISDLLEMDDVSDISLEYPDMVEDMEKSILCYKAIKDIINSLTFIFEKIHTEQIVKEQQIAEVQEAMIIHNLNIRERIDRAVMIMNDRLQSQADGSDRDELEKLEGTEIGDEGIPNEIPSENMIYMGDADL